MTRIGVIGSQGGRRRLRFVLVFIAILAAITGGLLTVDTGARTTTTVVMSGLSNPRGLAFGPEGGLYVVEAGQGGIGPCTSLRGDRICYGGTGSLTRRFRGTQERVAIGLPSYMSGSGEVTGAHDVSFRARGGAYVTVGFGGDPASRSGFGFLGARFGTLLHVAGEPNHDFDDGDNGPLHFNWLLGDGTRPWSILADVSAYEATANPDGGLIDSNPFGLLAQAGAQLVTDAGANAILRVDGNANISTVAAFPTRPARATDTVPTSIVVGPDGAYYVGELTGAPFTDGVAQVYRLVTGQQPTVFAAGFKTIIDIDFGPDGSLYVLQYATGPVFFSGPGQVIRVAKDGTRSVVVSGLDFPTSLLVADDGTIYVTNHGGSVGTGEVLRIE